MKNNKEISINYLPHSRPHYFKTIFRQLINIKPENKQLIEVNIFVSHGNSPHIDVDFLIRNGIDAQVIYNPQLGKRYMGKVGKAVDISKQYCVSLDEDVFMNTHIWNFLIENRHILDNTKTLLLSPLLSTGIPSADWFIEQFFSLEDQASLYSKFKNTKFEQLPFTPPGCTSLNKSTINADTWDCEAFYRNVSLMDTHYKGIHPIRVSADLQEVIVDMLLDQKDKLLNEQNLEVFYNSDRPYFCNNIFMIKTENYKKIIEDRSLFVDRYDEVPLNRYRLNNNLDMAFISNGFAVHPTFNWIGDPRYLQIADKFFTAMESITDVK